MTEGIPIKPSEVRKNKAKLIPPYVIDAFSELITKHFDGDEAKFTQSDVISSIFSKCHMDMTRELIFKNKWLDVEPIFEEAGWDVEYDKPGYCEDYEASFKFTPKDD